MVDLFSCVLQPKHLMLVKNNKNQEFEVLTNNSGLFNYFYISPWTNYILDYSKDKLQTTTTTSDFLKWTE